MKKYPFFKLILSLILITTTSLSYSQSPFITVWATDSSGISAPNQVTIPATGDFNYTWVDVNNAASTGSGSGSGSTTITFPLAGLYEVSITPVGADPFHAIKFIEFSSSDKDKLLTVSQWGSVQWSKFQFNDCSNLSITATDIPNLSNMSSMSFTFSHSGVSLIPNINDWDVSQTTDMNSLFQNCAFNQSLSNWDVSQVTDMSFMFDSAYNFNQPLNNWNVSSLLGNSYMFRDAVSFNQDLANWSLDTFFGGVAVFLNSGMSCENYSYTLYGWASNPNTNTDVLFSAYGPDYSPDVEVSRNYLINNLGWSITGDTLGTCSVPLSVSYIYFKAQPKQDQSWLQWSTASETNNRGFNIERSADGNHWQQIGFVAAASQINNEPGLYTFVDEQPLKGANYYRLKQLDLDGAFNYSQVRSVTFNQSPLSRVYPNPVTDKLVLSGLSGMETIRLFDPLGRALVLPAIDLNAGLISFESFDAGLYYLVITLPNGMVETHKIIKK